jgi:hypothetical protein
MKVRGKSNDVSKKSSYPIVNKLDTDAIADFIGCGVEIFLASSTHRNSKK